MADVQSESSGPDEDWGADFDGSWNNRGVIRGNVLTWLDGPTTRVLYTSATSLAVVLGDITYNGELLGDGRLLWDDGDVWTRQSPFDGLWGNRCLIDGNILKWNDGPATRPVIKGQMLDVDLDGRTFHGELRADGRLHWDDGDVWTRHVVAIGDTIKAKVGIDVKLNGVEFFKAGDEGIVSRVGRTTFDVRWKRTGRSSSYYVKSFTNAFILTSESSKCGFSRFDQVITSDHAHGVPKGQPGNIVGFNQDLVEVKFKGCICKCRPEGLRLWNHDSSISCEQSHAQDSTHLAVSPPVSHRVTGAAQREERRPDHKVRASCKRAPSDKPQRESKAALASFANDAVTPSEIPVDSKRYDGVVTWSRGTMAWISCKELVARFPPQKPGCYVWFGSERLPDYHVFLHKNNCDVMPKQWDHVSFRLALDPNSNPKALQAITIQSEARRRSAQ